MKQKQENKIKKQSQNLDNHLQNVKKIVTNKT